VPIAARVPGSPQGRVVLCRRAQDEAQWPPSPQQPVHSPARVAGGVQLQHRLRQAGVRAPAGPPVANLRCMTTFTV